MGTAQVPHPFSRTLTAAGRRELELQLTPAVDEAIGEALKWREGGVLVTRHSHTRFSIELSTDVPFGLTLERDLRPA